MIIYGFQLVKKWKRMGMLHISEDWLNLSLSSHLILSLILDSQSYDIGKMDMKYCVGKEMQVRNREIAVYK